MIHDGTVLGAPLVQFTDTKANVEAMAAPVVGMLAYAGDTGAMGHYDGVAAAWVWSNETPLVDLGSYAQGALIYGDVADWVALPHPGVANRVLQSTAAEVGWSANAVTFPAAGAVPVGSGANTQVAYWSGANTLTGDVGMTYNAGTDSLSVGNVYVPDGGTFGIAGNELLTVHAAANTFAFTGIAGVTVEDGDWIGIGAAAERIEYHTAGVVAVMGAKLGMGIAAGLLGDLHIVSSATNSNPAAIGASDGSTLLLVYEAATGAGAIFLNDAAGVNNVVFRTYGDSYILNDLGVGTTGPGYRLSVNGNTAGNDGINLANAGAGNPQVSWDNPIGTQKAAITWVEDSRLQFYITGPGDMLALTTGGNVGIKTAVFGTNAVGVLGIANGTQPTTSPANMIQLFSMDIAGGVASVGIRTEETVTAGAPTPSHKVKIKWNGVEYWLSLDAV